MEALVELLERWHPGIAATFEPASEDDIDELCALTGPLPAAYLRFLRTMGASTGGFQVGDALFDLGTVMEANAKLDVIDNGWASPFALVAVDPLGDHFFIDRDSKYGEDDCMVVRMPPGRHLREHRTRLHAGFEEMLYHEAYRTERMPRLAHQRRFVRPGDKELARHCSAVDVCAQAETLGFLRVPPAARNALYERGDAALLLHQSPASRAFSLVLGAESAAELERMGSVLRATTGVVGGE